MSTLNYFNEMFSLYNFSDDFKWNSQWNEEIEKWLAFIDEKDHKHYELNKSRARTDKQRDELLGEYKAAYFIEKKARVELLKFIKSTEPNKKIPDFRFKDKDGVEWFAEVKSPSYRNEVVKGIENSYLKKLRGEGISMRVTIDEQSEDTKYIRSIKCPSCKKDIDLELEIVNYEIKLENVVLKKTVCGNCKQNIWKFTEKERACLVKQRLSQPQFINRGFKWFDGSEAVEDAVRKSVPQFEKGNNNLLIITPNMFSDAGLMTAMDEGHKVRQILQRYDQDGVITCVLILDVVLLTEGFKYIDIWISAIYKNMVMPKN